MDSVSPTNQKDNPISRDQWDRQADSLIEMAKTNPELRQILVKALLKPGDYLGGARLSMKNLLAAFRVADMAGSTVYFEREDLSAFNRWRGVWEFLLSQIREDLARPMLRARDVQQLKIALREIQQSAGGAPGIDWNLIQEDLKVLERTARRYDSFPKETPRRGRSLSEHQKRIIACVELLRQCGVRDPCQKVVEALCVWGINRQWKTVSNLWSRYKNYRRRHPDREALPAYWVKIILLSNQPQLNAWIQRQADKTHGSNDKPLPN